MATRSGGPGSAQVRWARPNGARPPRGTASPSGAPTSTRRGSSFASEADVPELWDCPRCGLPAGQDQASPPPAPRNEPYKTHLAYVRERRSDADGDAFLEEALTRLHRRRPGLAMGSGRRCSRVRASSSDASPSARSAAPQPRPGAPCTARCAGAAGARLVLARQERPQRGHPTAPRASASDAKDTRALVEVRAPEGDPVPRCGLASFRLAHRTCADPGPRDRVASLPRAPLFQRSGRTAVTCRAGSLRPGGAISVRRFRADSSVE